MNNFDVHAAIHADMLRFDSLTDLLSYISVGSTVADMLRFVNNERARHGAGPVRLDDELMSSAQAKADDMCERNYYSHVDPDGNGPCFSENIAKGQRRYDAVFDAWRRSTAHHANMIDPHWSRLGVGLNSRAWTWVQHFA